MPPLGWRAVAHPLSPIAYYSYYKSAESCRVTQMELRPGTWMGPVGNVIGSSDTDL